MAPGCAQYFSYTGFFQTATCSSRTEVDEIDACDQQQQYGNARKYIAVLDVALYNLISGKITFQIYVDDTLKLVLGSFFLAYKGSVPVIYFFLKLSMIGARL